MGSKKSGTGGDQLVEMHLNARKKRRRKTIITMVVIVVVVLAVITAAVIYAQNKVSETLGSSSSTDVESAQVTTGSISTTVTGSGTLSNDDVESLEMLSSLEIDEFLVDEGDTVEEGDLIATVTETSLFSAMSSMQSTLDSLDDEIEEAEDDEIDSSITAGASGRIKAIYVSSGDSVADVMYESGSLMLISLDGYLAVTVDAGELEEGDTVKVKTSDGDKITGTVDDVTGSEATVLVTDNGTTYGDEVTVIDSDGNKVGTGTLYIHSQIAVTGYAGTVSSVSVSENETVSAGDTLITLTDTETTVLYDSLVEEREEMEELMSDLLTIYNEGGITATISGSVESLTDSSDASAVSGSTSSGTTDSVSTSYTTVATISPDSQMSITISVDETDILSLSEGLDATVTIDSIGEDEYTGTVTDISTTATSDSGVTAYSAVVTIDKTDDMLSGMSASVVITIEGVEDALIIPIEALHQTSSTSYVYTEYDEDSGEFSGMVEVTTGISNSSYVEITDGLSEGDTVYYTTSEDSSLSDMMSSFGDMGGMSDTTGGGDFSGDTATPDSSSGGGMSGGGGGMSGAPSN